jgi:hypothetical protein
MAERNWVSVGEYGDRPSAQVASQRLSIEGIENSVVFDSPLSAGQGSCCIWVPPESAEDAKRILATPAVSEAELTALALKYPPPDDI